MQVDPRVLFGRRLRELRKTRGWSQEQLGLESDLDRTYIGGVEQGRRNISLLNICKISEALGIKPNVLLDFEMTRKK